MRAVTAVLFVMAGLMPLSAADSASAASSSVQLSYTCDFPVIGGRPMTATVEWDTPASVPVGTATPVLPISVAGVVTPDIAVDLRLLGAVGLDGSVEADVAVQAPPNATVPESVPLSIPRTAIPASGSLTVPARGTTPALRFAQPGHAQVTVGAVSMHLDSYAVGGALVRSFDVPCRLDAGQNAVLASFDITVAPPVGSTQTPPASPTSIATTGTASAERSTPPSSAGGGTTSRGQLTPTPASGATPGQSGLASTAGPQSTGPATSSPAESSTGPTAAPSTSAAAADAPLAKPAGTGGGSGSSVAVLLGIAVALAAVGTAIVVGIRRLKHRQSG